MARESEVASATEISEPLAISGTLCTAVGPDYPPFPALHIQAAKLGVQLEASVATPHLSAAERAALALQAADRIYAWLTTPGPAVRLSPLSFGPVTDRATGQVTTPEPSGDIMGNLQLGDVDQVTATAIPLDGDGQPTTDTLVWTASVPDAVELAPSADTLSCVIGGGTPTPGVVVTATDSAGNTTSGDIDVTSGPATSLSLQFGPVTPKVAPAPAGPAAPSA
jgi:hypothetical protein